MAKILTVSRGSHHPIETLFITEYDLTLSQYLGPGSPRSKKAGGGLAYMLGE